MGCTVRLTARCLDALGSIALDAIPCTYSTSDRIGFQPLGDEAESKAHLDREPWRPGPPHTGPGTQTNEVITSQYTAFNFLFLNLWKQFKRPANVYFLGICILQCIRAVSITNGIPTTLLPLLFVLAVTALKDAIEDFNRHRAGTFFRSGRTRYTSYTKWTGQNTSLFHTPIVAAFPFPHTDDVENNRVTHVVTTAEVHHARPIPWREVKVGDVVLVKVSNTQCVIG